jgi:hypothetical protein
VSPMERRLSPAAVVVIWGIANVVLAAVLAGFTVAKSAGLLVIDLYCASAAIVFGVAVLVWLARRRRPLARGLRVPARPAAALLLAVGVALIWLGLAFGAWLPIIAVVPLAAALILELSARASS